MNLKKIYGCLTGVATLSALLVSCNTSEAGIKVAPEVQKVVPDSCGKIALDLDLEVPSGYVSPRSRLIVVPQLCDSSRILMDLDPLVLDAPIFTKKMQRKQKLDGYLDPYAGYARNIENPRRAQKLNYVAQFDLPEGEHNGNRILGVVTTDGCGECSAMDTVLMAVIVDPVELIKKEALQLEWIEPEFVIRPKIRKGRGEARLQFIINRYDIRLDLGENRQEMEHMLQTLKPIVEDTLAQLTSLEIYGLASADGPLSFNTPLARNRANSARKWLENQLQLSREQRSVITSDSRPEGWMPVLEAMVRANDPDSVSVKAILEKYASFNDDVQERYIRKLPCWKNIRERYLQKDRKVEYVYTYMIRSFTTDKELLEMYQKRPDAFNEEELLRVSTLKTDPHEKMEVYRTILHYFPQSQVAANNLAILLLREGKGEEAEQVLHSLDSLTDYALNTLAATYVYQNQYERAIELLDTKKDSMREARYNLGLVRAMQRRLGEAYELLRPYEDVNTAIVALSLNKNPEAEDIMQKDASTTPLSNYVRAMIAARLQKRNSIFEPLRKAIIDEKLRIRAVGEYDFMPYHDDVWWKDLFDQK